MSYNVLAQSLLESHSYLYRKCTWRYLKWEDRAARLYDEITCLSPDILCFQEVQVSHLNTFYSKFEKIGYSGIYKKKTGDTLIDGCAIYYKRSVFELEDVTKVEFYQPGVSLLDRHHVGIIAKLTPRCMPGSPLIVATTHLLYNPKRAGIRLAQMKLFLAEIDRVSYVMNGRDSGYLPILLVGDFNSSPNSNVIQLLDEGQVSVAQTWSPREHHEWKNIGITDNCQHFAVFLNRRNDWPTDFHDLKIQNSEYPVYGHPRLWGVSPSNRYHVAWFNEMFSSGILSHPLHFRSVYDNPKKENNNRFAENVSGKDEYLVDYMYFNSSTRLRPLARLRVPSIHKCKLSGQLPNAEFGSDHHSLVAIFELRSDKLY